MEKLFVITGNDKRTAYLAASLYEKECDVAVWHSELRIDGIPVISDEELAARECCMILSPATAAYETLTVLHYLCPGSIVFGGNISAVGKEYAAGQNITYYNLLEDEGMTILNAIPTAEGTLKIAIESTDECLNGMKVLILGYGRVGKAVAKLFSACGAQVKIVVRSQKDMAYARLNGLSSEHISLLSFLITEARIIVNTIPACVLNEKVLNKISKETLLIDLASGKGGLDHAEAKKLGLNVIHALALPGIYAPKSAAQFMEKSILNSIHENEGEKG